MIKQVDTAEDLVRPRKHTGRIMGVSAASIILIAALAALWVLHPWQVAQEVADVQTATATQGDLVLGLSASGTTVMGTVQQKLPSELSSLSLKIDSIQATVDGSVQAGDKLLTIDADSLSNARQDLETDVHLAQNTYDLTAATYKNDLVNARDELASHQQLKTIAEQDHTIALFDLQSADDAAKKAMDQAHQIIAEYPAAIKTATTRLQYFEDAADDAQDNADALKKAADKAQEDYQKIETEISNANAILDFLDENSLSDPGDAAATMKKNAQDAEGNARDAANAAKKEYDDESAWVSNLNKEVSARQTVLDNLEADLESAQENVAEIELTYYKANLAFLKGTIPLDETYQSNLIDYSNAQNEYNVAIQASQVGFDEAKLALEKAKSKLATFESTVGTGALLAANSGKVSAIGFAEGDSLSSDTPYVTMAASNVVTVPLSIDQTLISQVSVGDTAQVTIGQANYDGIVSSIQPMSSSASRSNVNYTVTVDLKGDLTGLSSDMTASVILNAAK